MTPKRLAILGIIALLQSGCVALGDAHAGTRPKPAVVSDGYEGVGRLIKRDCEAEDLDGPSEIEECVSAGIVEIDNLLSQSTASTQFHSLLEEMFEPLVFSRTGGGDALRERAAVSMAYFRFAKRRAEILLRLGPRKDLGPLLRGRGKNFSWSWIKDPRKAKKLELLWEGLVHADCRAYPIAQCEEQLNAALDRMTREIRQ